MDFDNKSPSLEEYKDGIPRQKKERPWLKWVLRGLMVVFAIVSLVSFSLLYTSSNEGMATLGRGSISGSVLDENGQPLKGKVFVQKTDREYTLAEDGSFQIGSVPAGVRSLIIVNNGAAKEIPVNVVAGQSLNLGELRFERVTPEPPGS